MRAKEATWGDFRTQISTGPYSFKIPAKKWKGGRQEQTGDTLLFIKGPEKKSKKSAI